MSDAIRIRAAEPTDAPALCELLAQLGYPATVDEIPHRLEALNRVHNAVVLVAANRYAEVIGLATSHIFPSIHDNAPIAWLTSLVVLEDARGAGVGSALVEHVEEWAASQGAKRLSLTSGVQRRDAHDFYRRRNYENSGLRFSKPLGE